MVKKNVFFAFIYIVLYFCNWKHSDAPTIAQIFGVNRPAIVKHVGNIYKSGELEKAATCSILEQVATDGKKRKMNFYNLDMILSVGYRVNS